MSTVKSVCLVTLSLLAFAGNSVLCRVALKGDEIDAANFTLFRIFAGAVVLWLILWLRGSPKVSLRKNLVGGWLLFVYAACFSFAYISLSTATGALILFATVQFSLIANAFKNGQQLSLFEWLGVLFGIFGLLVLLAPSASSPDIYGVVLMALSGFAWAGYTIMGQKSVAPLHDTSAGFLIALPVSVVLLAATMTTNLVEPNLTVYGVLLATVSGGLTSGLGYAIWYAVLPFIKSTTAAVTQLAVPLIAALFGVFLLAEPLTLQFLVASIMILGGIYLVIGWRQKSSNG